MGTPRLAWIAGVVLACSGCDGASDPVRLVSSTPPYGPLVGGTRITLAGSGFAGGGDVPVRVFVAGREAPLVARVDDQTLEVLIPPGQQAGDAEVVVLSGDRNARATGIFHYSTPPMLDAVAPVRVLYTSQTTRIAVTGSGFVDEGAGDVTLLIDGQPARDVTVDSDTALSFTAWPGRPLVEPDLELVDQRGHAARLRAFRYLPSERPGLLLFPTSGLFAVFFDPSDLSFVSIPWVVSPSIRFTAVVRDDRGDYWGLDRSRRFGRIDMKAQRLDSPIQAQGWFPTMILDGGAYLTIERSSLRFGAFDPGSGFFEPIGNGASIPCCGSYGLASDGTTLYYTARQGTAVVLGTIDRITGELGPPLTLTAAAGFHVEEMRFFAGTLYAVSRDGTLVTIDTTTGVVSPLPVNLGRFNAMEVFP